MGEGEPAIQRKESKCIPQTSTFDNKPPLTSFNQLSFYLYFRIFNILFFHIQGLESQEVIIIDTTSVLFHICKALGRFSLAFITLCEGDEYYPYSADGGTQAERLSELPEVTEVAESGLEFRSYWLPGLCHQIMCLLSLQSLFYLLQDTSALASQKASNSEGPHPHWATCYVC